MLKYLPLLALVTSSLLAADAPSASSAPDQLTLDYSALAQGEAYTATQVRQSCSTLHWFEAPGAAAVHHTAAAGDKPAHAWLEHQFKANTAGPGRQGLSFAAPLAPFLSYYVSYEVQFPAGFEFTRDNAPGIGGGLLPGLNAGNQSVGDESLPNGMSARPMWRRDNNFSTEPMDYLELFVLWHGQPEGESILIQPVEAGQTYALKIQVALGSADTDGFVRCWVDGELRLERPYRFVRPEESWFITQYTHNLFYAGDTAVWAPARDGKLLLGPVKVDYRSL